MSYYTVYLRHRVTSQRKVINMWASGRYAIESAMQVQYPAYVVEKVTK